MSDARWWIAAQGRAWGPYPAARLTAFRDEGRLGPGSLVGRDEFGPFAGAADTPELAALFAAVESGASPSKADAVRSLLVVSDASDADLPRLEADLAARGAALRIRPGLWLLRTSDGPSALRNLLSRGLSAGAMLLVVQAPLAHAAWFNLDGDTDRSLRRLWSEA